jgi:hypothetical protein
MRWEDVGCFLVALDCDQWRALITTCSIMSGSNLPRADPGGHVA